MKIFSRFTTKKEVNPLSKELLDGIMHELETHGITEKKHCARCALKLLQSFIKMFEQVNIRVIAGDDYDTVFEELVPGYQERCNEILPKHGITDKEAQGKILDSMITTMTALGKKNAKIGDLS